MDGFNFGRILIILGGILLITGIAITFLGRFTGLGRLPGDIFIQKGNFGFYFPVVSSIILSILLTVILNFIFRR